MLKNVFSKPISNFRQNIFQLSGTLQVSLSKPLTSLHRIAIKIVLLKLTSLTNEDYKNTTLLPLKPDYFVTKLHLCTKLSGNTSTYLIEKVSTIIQRSLSARP